MIIIYLKEGKMLLQNAVLIKFLALIFHWRELFYNL